MLADTDDARERASRRSDTALAVRAAAAMIAFAWSGFQSAEWVRERFLRSDSAASLSEQALELSAEADRLQEQDIVLYLEWRVALDGGDTATAEVIFGLFRPPLQSYLAAAPVDEVGLPLAPPFDDPEYGAVKRRVESDRFEAQSANHAEASRRASKNGARYGGLGVLFATVLAAVSIAGRFEELWIRRALIGVALVMLMAGLVYLLLSPLSITQI